MIEILKLLCEIKADLQTDRKEWMKKKNQEFNEIKYQYTENNHHIITDENYYPSLCGVVEAEINFVILKVKQYIKDYEFMQQKIKEDWEEEWREEHGC